MDPAGHLVSEKYDGARALWDGQRLRFRSGLSISAPAWCTAPLPAVALDGELWLGRGRFEPLSCAVHRQRPTTPRGGKSDSQREQPPRIGAGVTSTHRGLTAGAVPRFASFLRVREI